MNNFLTKLIFVLLIPAPMTFAAERFRGSDGRIYPYCTKPASVGASWGFQPELGGPSGGSCKVKVLTPTPEKEVALSRNNDLILYPYCTKPLTDDSQWGNQPELGGKHGQCRRPEVAPDLDHDDPSVQPPAPPLPANGWVRDPNSDTNHNGLCDGDEHCVYTDPTTGLVWSKHWRDPPVGMNQWNDICSNMTYGGLSGWHLPTKDEALAAYRAGIWAKMRGNGQLFANEPWWGTITTSTIPGTSDSWHINVDTGVQTQTSATSLRGLCVRGQVPNSPGPSQPTAPSGPRWSRDSASDTNGNGFCDGAEHCIFRETASGIYWSKHWRQPSLNITQWQSTCAQMTYGGYSGWRLPTSNEVHSALLDGMWDALKNSGQLFAGELWWGTQTADLVPDSSDGWFVNADTGVYTRVNATTDTSPRALCVRE